MTETKGVGEVTVRRARESDDAAVGELLVNAFVSAYAVKMPHVIYTEERKQELRNTAEKRKHAVVLVAEEKGQLVGTVSLWPPGAKGSEAWIPGACDLRQLGTDPATHGRGISSLLLDEIERIAREELHAKTICLHVRRGVDGVMRLYQKRGYLRDAKGDLELPTVSLMAFAKQL